MEATRSSGAQAFFIYDPNLVSTESKPTDEDFQDAKIIYYSPSYATQEEKRSQVSLIEGLVAFTQQFEPESPLESLRTDELSFVVSEVEPSLWFTLVIKLPEESCPSDGASLAILKNCHTTFCLLHGPIRKYLQTYDLLKLVDLLEDFIPAYMDTIDYTLTLPGGQTSLFSQLQGFHYAPVERATYVAVASFIQRLQQQFPGIRHSCLLYHAHLIYSGLSLDDMKVLYNYLVSFNGIVRTTKLNELDAKVLEMLKATAMMRDMDAPEDDGMSLVELQPIIARQFSQVMDHDDGYRFVYYNRANNALRLSNRTEMRHKSEMSSTQMPLKAHETNALAPLYQELETSEFREINFKTADHGWIVVKRALEREFFLLLDNPNMTLTKCQEECARFASLHFTNILMT
eukprot:GEMP01022904.1.p1 GENE.GEMP01022904.1~~GEMP01022904.1.p1  ORF type:complete len:402 (+),score=73.32 GEMP01022904.1:114-1319(+)